MREKEMRLVVTFHTTAEAMATEKACQEHNIAGKLISAPRAVTADCGIAWSGALETKDTLREMLLHEKIEFDGFYEMLL